MTTIRPALHHPMENSETMADNSFRMLTGGRVLVVVAHPDDEVLGAGGTIHALTQNGVEVTTAILCGSAKARTRHPGEGNLRDDACRASELLGTCPPIFYDFPNLCMNTVDHIELVQAVEAALDRTGATSIFCTHPGDINDDHRQASTAAQAAARQSQRQGGPASDLLAFMEINSSTEWSYPGNSFGQFIPNEYVQMSEESLARKIAALEVYRDVMRPFPHPRSSEAIRSLATTRGFQSGLGIAEAFQAANRVWPLPQSAGGR
jgi:LmbE family N-acetylglucosaminyl deacetylase